MSRVVHFEILIDQPERALGFYENVFGWKAQKWGGPQDYWLVATGEPAEPGINGALMRRAMFPVSVNCINIIGVDSVDQCLAQIAQHGGQVVRSKMPIPGVGYAAYCRDTEGNLFGIFQEDKSAQ